MSDYRRIDPDGLATQARALERLSEELGTTARRVDGTLAGVGRGASTAPIVDTAQWLGGWASTMRAKAAIAAQAVEMPVASVSAGAGRGNAAGSEFVLRTVRVPRWVERPVHVVATTTEELLRPVVRTRLVSELRTVTERVLERVPIWKWVTRYQRVSRPTRVWREVRMPEYVRRTQTVFETQYRQVAQYVSDVIPVRRTIAHFVWNGRQFVPSAIDVVSYQRVSRVVYRTIPVRIERTMGTWVQQWVSRRVPVTEWRTAIEAYRVLERSWAERWVTRSVQRLVTVPKKVVAYVAQTVTTRRSTVERRGEWIWEERQVLQPLRRGLSSEPSRFAGRPPRPPEPTPPQPEPTPEWRRPIAEDDARALADAIGAQLSPALLSMLVAAVNAQTDPIYSAGRPLNADERLVAALEAAKQGTPQGAAAAAALIAGRHPDGTYASAEQAFDERVSLPLERLVKNYLRDPYNQASLAQSAVVALGAALGGTAGGAIAGIAVFAGLVAKLHFNANAWRDDELTVCEAKARNLIEGAFAIAPGGGIERKIGKALGKKLADAWCPVLESER